MKDLGLPISATPDFWVKVGNGHKVKGQGACDQVELEIQGIRFQQKLFLFPLEDVEIVLGWEWLASLGNIKANFQEYTLRIKRQG